MPYRATCRSNDLNTYWVVLILRIGESIGTDVLIAVLDRLTFDCVYETKGNLIDRETWRTDRDGVDEQVGKPIIKTRHVSCRPII